MSDIKYFRDLSKYPRPISPTQRWGVYSETENFYNKRAAGWNQGKIEERDIQFGFTKKQKSPKSPKSPKFLAPKSLLTEELKEKTPVYNNRKFLKNYNDGKIVPLKPVSPDEKKMLTSSRWNLDYNQVCYKLEKLKTDG